MIFRLLQLSTLLGHVDRRKLLAHCLRTFRLNHMARHFAQSLLSRAQVCCGSFAKCHCVIVFLMILPSFCCKRLKQSLNCYLHSVSSKIFICFCLFSSKEVATTAVDSCLISLNLFNLGITSWLLRLLYINFL